MGQHDAARPAWRRFAVAGCAALGTALIGWLVSFVGPKLWTTTERAVSGEKPPVQLAVVTDVDRFRSRARGSYIPEFIITRPLAQVGPPPNGSEVAGRWKWAHELGGIDAYQTLIRIKISGADPTPVIVDNLRIKVIRRAPAMAAPLFSYLGLGSGQGVRYFEVDLDRRVPLARYVGGSGAGATKRDPLPLRVTRRDVEVIDLLANTLHCDCEWVAQLDWESGTRTGELTIDDHGRPFRTAAPTANAAGQPTDYRYWQSGRWQRYVEST
jgi:hypothetical protein